MQSSDPFVLVLREWFEAFVRRSMRNFIIYARSSGLSMSQIGALFRLSHGGGGVSDLGEDLGITSAAASQMLERLVQQKFILRTEDLHDRRFKQIALTEKGRQTLKDSMFARQHWLDELSNNLTESEKDQITAALKILIEKTQQLEPGFLPTPDQQNHS